MYTYQYPRHALTADSIIFGLDESSQLKVLLIERGHEPFEGFWALPGGFVEPDEPLDAAAKRELQEETGLQNVFMEQLYTFGDLGRDPRGHVITVAYMALINLAEYHIAPDTDARDVRWFPILELPNLAFDHAKILDVAIHRLRGKVRYQPLGFELLSKVFTLTQLQQLYETILGISLNKRNFRAKILKMNILQEDAVLRGVAHRPAQMYRFDEEKYQTYLQQGFNFEL
jgi:8-oxo-dGTP diphosphatase